MKKVTLDSEEELPRPAQEAVPGVNRSGPRKAGEATRERMLDSAEALFATHGYHGTSMRDVAEAAGSRIALVTYHFGSKDTLFSKVVERRASFMAHQRIQALDSARVRAAEGPIPLRDLVAGYVWPFVERSTHGGQGWKNYSLLVARIANSPDWAIVISAHYDAVARQYLAEFRSALPTVSDENVFRAFSFMVGAMLGLVAEPRRIENLSFGKFKSDNLEHVYETMLPFLVGGFESLAVKRQEVIS